MSGRDRHGGRETAVARGRARVGERRQWEGGIEVNSSRNNEWEAPGVGGIRVNSSFLDEWEEEERWSDRVWESVPECSRGVGNSGNDVRNARGGGRAGQR